MSNELETDELKCEVLLFFATQSEREQLYKGAVEFGLPFDERKDTRVDSYYNLGTIGQNRVRAVKTKMGPFFHGGSASQAVLLRAASSATSIIQLGMAFGIDRQFQKHGDVLISQWLFPYDDRKIRRPNQEEKPTREYVVDYEETQRFRAKPWLLKLFDLERSEGKHPFAVHVGGILSGGSRIYSQPFLKELLKDMNGTEGPGGYVGGEMEGVGLLSACKRGEPIWAVVKGISDFADDQRDQEIENTRPQACLNAVRFVLSALTKADKVAKEG